MGGRANAYSRREAIYKRGASGIVRGRLNKAGPAIDKQAALLFAPHLIKFAGVVPPEEEDEAVWDQIESVTDAIQMMWSDLDLDLLFPMGVKYGLVDGCRIISCTPQIRTDGEVELRADLIHPRDFGVSREIGAGSWKLSNQQAVCVRSYHSPEELDRWVRNRPDKNEVYHKLAFVQVDAGERGSRISGMAPGATQLQAKPQNWPSVSGDGEDPPAQIAAEFYDLRLYDDDLGDWRLFTISGDVILADRPGYRCGVPQMLPYAKICPDEDPESFWGSSLIENITPLQEWYLNRMEGMDEKFRMSLRPPTAGIGLGQGFQEKLAGLSRAGGRVAFPNQNASIQQFKPEMSESDYTMMQVIASQMDEQSQIAPMMRGRNEPGVRGESVLNSLRSLASAEIIIKSLQVQSQCEDFAQLIFQSMRRYNTHKLRDSKKQLFWVAQFPADVKIRVDAHSSSPIAVEDLKTEAKGLFQMGIVKPSRVIRMLSPMMQSLMLHDLEAIEQAQMIAREKIKLEQQLKRGGKEQAGVEA
jgi:hypothetical protein